MFVLFRAETLKAIYIYIYIYILKIKISTIIIIGRRFAAALLPRLFGTNPRSHHKGSSVGFELEPTASTSMPLPTWTRLLPRRTVFKSGTPGPHPARIILDFGVTVFSSEEVNGGHSNEWANHSSRRRQTANMRNNGAADTFQENEKGSRREHASFASKIRASMRSDRL